MNIRILLLTVIVFSGTILSAQNKNTVITDQKLRKDVLVGFCDRNGLKSGIFGKYFVTQYDAYKPSRKIVEKIKEKIDKTKIVIIFGSWCSDSKIQVPRFYKILDKSGYNENDVTLIAVDRSKRAMTTDISKYEVTRIPVFIVFQNGKELGRIVESPKKTLEKDLLKILKKVR
jgi:thiol-disulfide isomerase/thioredoxin